MIVLDTTTKKLEIVLSESANTQIPFFVSYVEVTTTTYTPASNQGTSNNTTDVTVVDVPSGASTQRSVKFLSINNIDNITHNITIQLDVSGANSQVFKAQLFTLEKLVYTDSEGWRVYDATGFIKNNFGLGVTAISASTTSAASGQIVFSNSNNISFGVSGQTITASYDGNTTLFSSYQNTHIVSSIVLSSATCMQQFNNPGYLSLGFLRLPALMTTNSTSLTATVSGANASAAIYSTLYASILTQGTGTDSSVLKSVVKGSCGWTLINSVSMAANASQGSYSQTISGYAKGAVTSYTSQYSVSNLNSQQYSTDAYTNWSSVRFLDIPLNTGSTLLIPGDYWLVFAMSSATYCNSTGFSNITNCNVRFSGTYANVSHGIALGYMGASNRSSVHFGNANFGVASPDIDVVLTNLQNVGGINPAGIFQLLASNCIG